MRGGGGGAGGAVGGRRGARRHALHHAQAAVGARLAERHERVVRARLDDGALGEHDDAVGVRDGREPVRDDDGGARALAGDGAAVVEHAIQRRLHDALRRRVERAGGLVEQQQRRRAQDGARNADALALAARQRRRRRGRADVRRIALGQAHNELVRIGSGGRRRDLGGRGHALRRTLAIADVLRHRHGKERRLLRDDADVVAQGCQVPLAHVDAVDEHGARARLVVALHELQEGGLAAAALADERHRRAALDDQAEIP